MRMKLLFIDHECHRMTRSTDFFLDIIRKEFEVEEHYYSRCYETGSKEVAAKSDCVIIWEFPISRRRFFFPGRSNIFIPMYDNEWASYWQWKRIAWSGMGVISFCNKVSAHARKCGVTNLLDVRFFPDPASLPQLKGDPKKVFLWERGDICRDFAERLFPSSAGFSFDIKRDGEFLDRDVYLERLAKCGIVIAPRRKEGIGMAFLEAMAMGKCVVANDDATMNEYIVNGETGILFSCDEKRPVTMENVEYVIGNVAKSAIEMFARWKADSANINDFIAGQLPCTPSLANRVKIALSYPLFLLEGIFHVLCERLAVNQRWKN